MNASGNGSASTDAPSDEVASPPTPRAAHGIRGRRQYTVAKKTETLQLLKTKYNDNRSLCARETGVPRTVLIDWIKESEKFTLVSESRLQSVKRVRHALDPESKAKRGKFSEMEVQLVQWIKEQRAQGLTVDTTLIMMEGKAIFDSLKEKDASLADASFLASKGWAARFLVRHGLVSRAFTSVGQKIPDHALTLARQMFEVFDKKAESVEEVSQKEVSLGDDEASGITDDEEDGIGEVDGSDN